MTTMLKQSSVDELSLELDQVSRQVKAFCLNLVPMLPVTAEVYCYTLGLIERAIAELHACFSQLQQQQDHIQHLLDQNQALEYQNESLRRELAAHKQMQTALQYQAQQEGLLDLITHRIRRSLNLEYILQTTVDEVQKFLQVDRVVIYRFKRDWSGVVTVESVADPRHSILYSIIEDPCFREIYVDKYKQGRVQAMDDVDVAGIPDCYLDLLKEYGIRASLVMPIVEGEDLWGLLIAHHCTGPRHWEATDIVLMGRLSSHLAIAIQQSQLYEQVQRLAAIDELTQVANRRQFEIYYEQTWRQFVRHQGCLSLLMCDIDSFKAYNDTYGHIAGDACLKQVAAVLKSALNRSGDLIARYGGEEFIMVLPDTDLAGARHIANEIIAKINDLAIKHRTSQFGHVTLSLGGISLAPSLGRQPQNAIKAADNALYQAKSEGRNRAVLFELG